jgi:NADH-quinone oxidoreductase subunit M
MILVWLIVTLIAGGLLAWLAGRRRAEWARWVALGALLVELILGLALLISTAGGLSRTSDPWLIDIHFAWITSFGIQFHLAADGLSVVLIMLTLVLGLVATVCSWNEISHRQGFFYFNLLWVLAGIIGVFTALDLFLFYFFWELMMVPMFFLIAVWGHENRIYAAVKFFLFTQISGLFMLAAIVGLVLIHARTTGIYTFEYTELIGTAVPPAAAMWLMLGFLVAFAVKLPAFPLHSWLPDAHTEAPTAGSIVLAGLLLKTGAYGMLRFAVPLFPHAARAFAPIAMVLGVIAVLYGALLAFAQTDLKRLVAYTSISHMGFVMLAVFAWNDLALQGTVIQMICHGLSTGALFAIVGMMQERLHTRDLRRMGGLWESMPRMGGMSMLFALASLGLPGLGNFVGEFLILFGAWPVNRLLTAIAALGLVAASVYSLWIMQQVFHGRTREVRSLHDLTGREGAALALMGIILIWLGVYPQPVFKTARPALRQLLVTQSLSVVRPTGTPDDPGMMDARVFASAIKGDSDATR